MFDLELTEDQLFLREEARRFLSEHAGSEALRNAVENLNGFDATLWRRISGELGWCGVAIAEAHGGLGLGALEASLLLEETGRRLACVPLWSTIGLAAPLIAATGSEEACSSLLGSIASGKLAVTAALSALNTVDPMTSSGFVRADEAAGGYTLSGVASCVTDLESADLLLVPARLPDGGLALFALEPGSAGRTEPLNPLDPSRPAGRLVLDGETAPVAARVDRSGVTAEDFERGLRHSRLLLAAEQIGAAQGCFDLTADYLAERAQFGRTIASFQAIKHRMAVLLVQIAEARSLLYGAARALDEETGGDPLEIAALGVLASQALFAVASEAIQLHGGVGMTWEYDPHFYLRRAQASAMAFGSGEARLEAVASALLQGGVA